MVALIFGLLGISVFQSMRGRARPTLVDAVIIEFVPEDQLFGPSKVTFADDDRFRLQYQDPDGNEISLFGHWQVVDVIQTRIKVRRAVWQGEFGAGKQILGDVRETWHGEWTRLPTPPGAWQLDMEPSEAHEAIATIDFTTRPWLFHGMTRVPRDQLTKIVGPRLPR